TRARPVAVARLGHSTVFPGAPATTAYGYDFAHDALVALGPPGAGSSAGSGQVHTVGPAGLLSGDVGDLGLDVRAGDNALFADLRVANKTGLYTLNPGTGAATFLGLIGDGTAPVRDLALDPPGILQFAAAPATVSEADGAAVLTVQRTAGSEGPVSVAWAIDGGSAVPGVDFGGPLAGTLAFGPGQASASFAIPLIHNAL